MIPSLRFRERSCLTITIFLSSFYYAKNGSLTDMSIDKSLRRKNSLQRARNVLTRGERIKTLQNDERWTEGRSPFGLPKVRVHRLVVKKVKKAKEEEKAAEGEAAPAGEKKAEKK
jgi:small basic protein (TIGR04137 family)